MLQSTGPALVQVMACHLYGTKPLPEPMPAYYQLDSWEQISEKLGPEFYHFHSRKCIWICRLPKWRQFYPGGDELKDCLMTRNDIRTLHIDTLTRWSKFYRWHFKMYFLECKFLWYGTNCHWSLFLRGQLKINHYLFRCGLVLNRWQAIIWTNVD